MKKLLTKLNIIGQNVAIGAVLGWFAFAISFDIMAIILYVFFPETWSEVAYYMNQFLGIY
jgi:hypothetical protein